jgi:Protein of unknown function (DUF3467)
MADEEKKIPDELQQLPPEIAKILANLKVTRSGQYRTVYSNVFRTRLAIGDLTIIFSKIGHTPSVMAAGDTIEEEVEVVMSWAQAKMFSLVLQNTIEAMEKEVAEIPIPKNFKIDPDAQRASIRAIGLVDKKD